MCEEYNDRRPLGSQDVENAWQAHLRKASTAMSSDIYTNGGLLDRTNGMGYETPAFYPSTMQQILERDFSYEELKFIAGARLMHMSMSDIDRLIFLLEKLKKAIKEIPVNGLPAPITPSTPSWNNPYYGLGGGIQPLYGCPISQSVEAEAQKGPNEPDEPTSGKKEVVFGSNGTPFPERIGKASSYKERVILSNEAELSSKDDSSLSKVVIDGPSTGIVINDKPVSLTEENKVDEENKD